MKSRWKAVGEMDPDREYVVFASSIPPSSVRSTGALFRGARVVRRQLASADGVVGFSLLAEPLRKRYATLSIWRDHAALEAFAAAEPHRRLMRGLAPKMAPTTFVQWTIAGRDGRPAWRDALARLDGQGRVS